ncbi:hypothetical protein [Pseudovibrio exalbescens]|uniref:hypothetical protein n=1 Tax=Pseudovibrio exalbescens TaxID=197461 RepID=UPI0003FDE924|nr:hypothetical protein [Pseudovibrio exalbescens]
MRLSAPSFIVFLLAFALGVMALLSAVGGIYIPVITGNTFWAMTGGWGLLVLGSIFKGV